MTNLKPPLKYKTGDMFEMEPDSRLIVVKVDTLTHVCTLAHLIADRVTDSPTSEIWSFEKMDSLLERKKISHVCNLFTIVIFRFRN